MANAPVVSWYEGTNETSKEVKSVVNYGVVDADSASPVKTFYIWNNRGGKDDCSKMEEVIFTTRDRAGGTGDTPGSIVEAVRDNWFHVRCDTLNEVNYAPVGKGGIENPSGTHALGTLGTTTNIDAAKAVAWSAGTVVGLNTVIAPAADKGFIYIVTKAGTTTSSEPAWPAQEGSVVMDGEVEFTAVAKAKTPGAQEILGLKNTVKADGSDAADAAGNFVKVSVFAEIPITASAGKNELLKRVSYRYV
jgi:hypothetical protein